MIRLALILILICSALGFLGYKLFIPPKAHTDEKHQSDQSTKSEANSQTRLVLYATHEIEPGQYILPNDVAERSFPVSKAPHSVPHHAVAVIGIRARTKISKNEMFSWSKLRIPRPEEAIRGVLAIETIPKGQTILSSQTQLAYTYGEHEAVNEISEAIGKRAKVTLEKGDFIKRGSFDNP